MKEDIDLALFTMGIDYLHTTQNILIENKNSGNAWMISYENKELSDQEYENQTKRSDFNVFLPTIFLFYHGIELILKGLLKLQEIAFKPDHKISKLYETASQDNRNKLFVEVITKYVSKNKLIPFIGDFLKENNQTIDKFYEMFRYPSNKDENIIYNFMKLKYTEEKGILFSNQLIEDINTIRKRVVKTYRERSNC